MSSPPPDGPAAALAEALDLIRRATRQMMTALNVAEDLVRARSERPCSRCHGSGVEPLTAEATEGERG